MLRGEEPKSMLLLCSVEITPTESEEKGGKGRSGDGARRWQSWHEQGRERTPTPSLAAVSGGMDVLWTERERG
jgi:hypothetical protein